MFTGLIEETGTIRGIRLTGESGQIEIHARKVLEDAHVGDSICVNGICLTVTSLSADSFTADIMSETVRRTAFRFCRSGDKVNLERAMPADGRFGGHIVAGHIDGTGQIFSIRPEGNATYLTIQTSPDILRLVVEKGSIAIDGVSLTVTTVENDRFSVGIIPHTSEETTLLSKRQGDFVNLETDIVGKYVERLLQPHTGQADTGGLTIEYLQEIGF